MLDAAEEVPEVRGAALLGLSYSAEPAAYATLLRVSSDASHPAWRAAVSRLGDVDDGFAPSLWPGGEDPGADPEARAFAGAQASRLRARVAARTAPEWADRVGPLLARAAFVDLRCAPFEGALVEWTLRALRERLAEPGVRAALGAWRDRAVAPGEDASLLERVRAYAEDLLAE